VLGRFEPAPFHALAINDAESEKRHIAKVKALALAIADPAEKEILESDLSTIR
jgi:hypothetical protein